MLASRGSGRHVTILVLVLAFGAGCAALPAVHDVAYHRERAALQVTMIGHATFLIDLDGHLILTDPWFYETALTGHHTAPLGLPPARLPRLDLFLISHDHRDHFDRHFLRQWSDKDLPVVAPPGMLRALESLGFTRALPVEPWQSVRVGRLVITATPAEHYGETAAYVIEGAGRTLYFAPETVFFEGLGRVAERFPRMDVVLLPADGLRFRWGRRLAMDPREAMAAVEVLRPRAVIPIRDHDFSRTLPGAILTTTGTEQELERLLRETDPDIDVVRLAPGCRWTPGVGVRPLSNRDPSCLPDVATVGMAASGQDAPVLRAARAVTGVGPERRWLPPVYGGGSHRLEFIRHTKALGLPLDPSAISSSPPATEPAR